MGRNTKRAVTIGICLVAAAAAFVAGAPGVMTTSASTTVLAADTDHPAHRVQSEAWATPTQADTYHRDKGETYTKGKEQEVTRPPTEQLRLAARKGWQVLWWTGVATVATTLGTTATFLALTVLSTFAREEQGRENRAAWMRALQKP